MSYIPTQWAKGDTVTAEKLNKMENGIAAAAADPFVITCTPTAQDYSGVMDVTFEEIKAAAESGKRIVFKVLMGNGYYYTADATVTYGAEDGFRQAFGYLFDSINNIIICAWNDTMEGTNHYSAAIYQLTPMS